MCFQIQNINNLNSCQLNGIKDRLISDATCRCSLTDINFCLCMLCWEQIHIANLLCKKCCWKCDMCDYFLCDVCTVERQISYNKDSAIIGLYLCKKCNLLSDVKLLERVEEKR